LTTLVSDTELMPSFASALAAQIVNVGSTASYQLPSLLNSNGTYSLVSFSRSATDPALLLVPSTASEYSLDSSTGLFTFNPPFSMVTTYLQFAVMIFSTSGIAYSYGSF
jgi:hypothetical protein